MKLKSNITPAQVLNIVQKCQGDVYLSTSAGDEINLKSALCQYLFVAVCNNSKLCREASLHCQLEEDINLLKTVLEI